MRFDDLQLIACFELLLGAAWADGDFAESERSALFELFCGMTGADRLTAEAQRLFGTFRPDRLDLDRACAALGFRAGRPPTDAVERRRAFLTLLGRVVDADEILEGGEGVYIGR
ncbi:MAG: TerB family tellurite resistance protein, partial [Myxococcales bacterium]|nr:TerB family tellurite resistance protein [Myxococcales bacterium]